MTMDGKIATYTGASKWITGEIARNHVQRQRHRFRGIMVDVYKRQVVCHADALDGAVDRLRVLRLAEAVQEYEV